ncbi:hypothetical protein ACFPAG_07800 [Vogesella sp. GCM10023246]|uniref:Uncharacterized protein n=1 Tax=Vogesella oryzagri TaxID=3160864 RepID=A0ABV1M4I9_9NEIS
MDDQHYLVRHQLHRSEADLAYCLDVFGDFLAQREGYKSVSGLDAVHFYLVHKFAWLPSRVRAMPAEELRFVLSEEMEGWTLPEGSRL